MPPVRRCARFTPPCVGGQFVEDHWRSIMAKAKRGAVRALQHRAYHAATSINIQARGHLVRRRFRRCAASPRVTCLCGCC